MHVHVLYNLILCFSILIFVTLICLSITFLVDRGNDNWLIKYERTPEVDRQVEGEEGVSFTYCSCCSQFFPL